jgi:hypothetical protein
MRSSKCSFAVRAQKAEGGDEVSELEKALGIENKTVRNISADKEGPQRRLLLWIPVPLFKCSFLPLARLFLFGSEL